MKEKVVDLNGNVIKEIELPEQFKEKYRPDLIRKAIKIIQSKLRQKYGAKISAGKRASAVLKKRRRAYRSSYGYGISRVPRKILSRRGRRFVWVGAFAPGTVGGRRAHPPKAEKIWEKKMNKKEKKKAIRSAISNSGRIVVVGKIEDLSKTKDVKDFLIRIGLRKELERLKKKKIRAGKGKMRGRKYKRKKGPLFVVSKDCVLDKACDNLGVESVKVNLLNSKILMPGERKRLVIWSENAINKLRDEGLFI